MEGTVRLAEQMAALRARFLARCPQHCEALLEACTQADVGTIQRLAHNIAGNAGMFGLPELSDQAAELSACCHLGNEHDIVKAARVMSRSLANAATAKGD